MFKLYAFFKLRTGSPSSIPGKDSTFFSSLKFPGRLRRQPPIQRVSKGSPPAVNRPGPSHLVPRLKMNGDTPKFLHIPLWRAEGQFYIFYGTHSLNRVLQISV
jgi:hypothetical protein